MTVGSALYRAVDLMLEKAKPIAAGLLEAAESDVTYENGNFLVVGTDRRVSLFEVAARTAKASGDTLDTKATVDTPQTFPNGCHIAEVEIDPETGVTEIVAYTAVDDAGVVLDHTLVAGQLVGGLAQGIGQALMENAVYDEGNGQLVTGTFMDYAMPRAQDMPPIAEANHNARATTNPLGVKGVGEAGTTGSIAAIMNAIANAIPEGRGNNIDMPATPAKVWAACRAVKLKPPTARARGRRSRAGHLAAQAAFQRRDLDAVAAARLGEIERLIGERDQSGEVLRRIDDHRHADARGRVQRLALDTAAATAKALRSRSATRYGVVDAGIRQHDHEFLATQAPDQIGLAQVRLRGPGEDLQHLVADRVTQAVVDRLEMIEVDQQHADRPVAPDLLRQQRLGVLQEGAAVEQAGQRIDHRGGGIRMRARLTLTPGTEGALTRFECPGLRPAIENKG